MIANILHREKYKFTDCLVGYDSKEKNVSKSPRTSTTLFESKLLLKSRPTRCQSHIVVFIFIVFIFKGTRLQIPFQAHLCINHIVFVVISAWCFFFSNEFRQIQRIPSRNVSSYKFVARCAAVCTLRQMISLMKKNY